MITIKKYFIVCCFLALLINQALAQNFAIKITQVYPSGGVVYGDIYNLSGELDKAEASLRSQYTGRDANYTMELTRPSGKETKIIQNIRWILVVNGTKNDRKEKPKPAPSYKESTTVKIYECNNDGTPKGKVNTINYDHKYDFFKNTEKTYSSDYMPLDKCKLSANEYFIKNKVDTLFCEIKIRNSEGIAVDSTINNLEAYNKYLAEQKQIRDSIKQDSPSKADSSKMEIDTVYNKQNIEIQLKQLQKKADSLKKGNKDFRLEMDKIIEKADSIIAVIKIDTEKDFDRNKYFEGDLNGLKKGIKKLQKINRKKNFEVDQGDKKNGIKKLIRINRKKK